MPTPQPLMWEVMQRLLPRRERVTLQQIYDLIEREIRLQADDFEPSSDLSNEPRWQRNVRNILQYRKGTGEILWTGDAEYMMP